MLNKLINIQQFLHPQFIKETRILDRSFDTFHFPQDYLNTPLNRKGKTRKSNLENLHKKEEKPHV